MKNNIGLLLLLFFLVSCKPSFNQPVKEHGQLGLQGVQLVDEHGAKVVLNGVSFGWHNFWPRFYTEETVSWLVKDWDISVVRAAMGVEPEKGYLQQPEWSVEKIENVIRGAIASDIYVIIDWHSHGLQTEGAVEFFSEMARKYGSNPHVIYEIFNEPVYQSWTEIKEYSTRVIQAIRQYDPDNIIIVGSPHWDQDIHLVADDPLTGFSNIMYSVHFYAATHGKSLRERCDYALSKGIPVFVSESAGMSANGDGPLDYTSWKEWLDWMEYNGISNITWSVSDKNETCSMLLPSASSTGNWSDSDLKESGLKTRELIRKQNKLY